MKYLSFYSLQFISLVIFLFACSGVEKESAETNSTPNGRTKEWRVIGVGGGGAMFTPAISPLNSNLAFVSCDMTGSYITKNGGDSWRMFNLRGVVGFYAFDPIDPNVIYANSSALFRSIDAGKTWNVIYPPPSEI